MDANGTSYALREFTRHHKAIFKSPEWERALPKIRNKFLASAREHDPEWFNEHVRKNIEPNADLAFEILWKRKRKWLKAELSKAEWARRRRRLRRGLARLGLGSKED